MKNIITNIKITEHKNDNGIAYYSKNVDGKTIYSFSEAFDDVWSQEDQDSGSAPSKI